VHLCRVALRKRLSPLVLAASVCLLVLVLPLTRNPLSYAEEKFLNRYAPFREQQKEVASGLALYKRPSRLGKPSFSSVAFAKITTDNTTKLHGNQLFGRRAPHFEPNKGQSHESVRFLSRGKGYNLFLTRNEAVLSLAPLIERGTIRAGNPAVVRMKFIGANPDPRVVGLEEMLGRVNYFTGKEPKKWSTNIPTYAKVKYENLYPGVDLIYYWNEGLLEFDFVLAPGADPEAIRFEIEGADKIAVGPQGDLTLQTSGGIIRLQKPFVYQTVEGRQQPIPVWYVRSQPNQVGFRIAAYDPTKMLTIDPVLIYSTYLGGGGNEHLFGLAVDAAGNAYVTGGTFSLNFPTTDSLQTTLSGPYDVFLAKFTPEGALVYSTYLGASGQEIGYAIAVDADGNASITGETDSTDFPTVTPAQPALSGGDDVFIAKVSPQGSQLIYSTYLGGTNQDSGRSIALDSEGSAYITGFTVSTDFPTVNALQPALSGSPDAFVAKLNPQGSELVYSTFLGGKEHDFGFGIAVDVQGNAYITGDTESFDFPTKSALQAVLHDDPARLDRTPDSFVAKLNPTGSTLEYSTYLGGIGVDGSRGIAIDTTGSAYVTGFTYSHDFPVFNPLQETLRGDSDAFVARLSPEGHSLLFSTYLGGSGNDIGFGIAVNSSQNIYIAGATASPDFPTENALQTVFRGRTIQDERGDAFVANLYPQAPSPVLA
jgi:hypothetical protein